jgi:hypothetical protein
MGYLASLCGECGESVVRGEDIMGENEHGEDCHEACLDRVEQEAAPLSGTASAGTAAASGGGPADGQ